jgi:hypothetical protein
MADEKKADLVKVDTLREGDSVALGGSIAATDERASETGESGARYYMKMKYQERQFLRAKDFEDEQEYHARKLRDHNKQLHTYGICDGFEVTKAEKYEGCVIVSAGSATDIKGNSMMLAGAEIVDLARGCVESNLYITPIKLYIRFSEANATDPRYNVAEGGFEGCTRTVEKPDFFICAVSDPSGMEIIDDSLDAELLLLAIVTRDQDTGAILSTNNNPEGRRIASVKMKPLENNAVTAAKIKDGAVTTDKLENNAVTTAKIRDGAVTMGKLENNAVTAAKIKDGAVTTDKLDNNAVTAAKIKDGAVTTNKLDNNSVTMTKIDDRAVSSAKIDDSAVETAKLKDRAVTTAKIADGAITKEKVSPSVFSSFNLSDGVITARKIAKNTITSYQLANASVNKGALQTHAVTFDKLNCIKVRHAQIALSPNASCLYRIELSDKQVIFPAGASVFTTTPGIKVVNGTPYSLPNAIFWYEYIEAIADNRFYRYIYLKSSCSVSVLLKTYQWYWES